MRSGSDRIVQQVALGTHPELDGLGVGQRLQVRRVDDAAEPGAPRVEGVVVPQDQAADGRAGTVGPDDEVGRRGRPVVEGQDRLGAAVVDGDEGASQLQGLGTDRRRENGLQVGPVDARVGRAVAAAVAVAAVVPADDLPRPAVAEDELGNLGPHRRESVTEPQTALVEPRGVRRQRDRRADLPQFGGPFVDDAVDTVATQRQGQREAADAGADDRDAR